MSKRWVSGNIMHLAVYDEYRDNGAQMNILRVEL